MGRPAKVRVSRHRSLRSHTTLDDEFSIPFGVYHGGRLIRWAWHRPAVVAMLFLALTVTSWTGSSLLGLVLAALLVVVAVVGQLWFHVWRMEVAAGAKGIDRGGFGSKEMVASYDPRKAWQWVLRDRPSVKQTGEWLVHGRQLEKRWPKACLGTGLLSPDWRRPPALHKVRPVESGGMSALIYSGAAAIPSDSVRRAAKAAGEIIGCRDVLITDTGKPGVVKATFHWADPVGRYLGLDGLPISPPGQLAYGVRPDGSPATINIGQSVLICGVTGSGKSILVHGLVADALRKRLPLRLYVSDPKNGQEFAAYEQHVGQLNGLFEVRRYADSPKSTVEMVRAVVGAMHKRQADMKARGLRSWKPTPEDPFVLVVLDEALKIPELIKDGVYSPLGEVVFTGRSAGYAVCALTQVAQVDALGRLRDLIPQRICLGTKTPEMTDAVLGRGAEAAGARCSRIGNRNPGLGYSESEDDMYPQRFRAANVTNAEVREIAQGHAPLYMPMPAQTGAGQQATALYRWFDADGQLLYVGISNSPGRRTDQHAASKEWMREDGVNCRVEWFPSRASAEAAEKEAIRSERPAHNVAHAGAWRRVRAGDVRGQLMQMRHRNATAADVDDDDDAE